MQCTSRCLSGFPSELPLCIAPQRLRPRTESPKTPSTLAIIWPWAPKSASLVTGTCPLREGLLSCLVVYEIGNPASKALGMRHSAWGAWLIARLSAQKRSTPARLSPPSVFWPDPYVLPLGRPLPHLPRQSWQSQRSPSSTMHDAISPQRSKELQLVCRTMPNRRSVKARRLAGHRPSCPKKLSGQRYEDDLTSSPADPVHPLSQPHATLPLPPPLFSPKARETTGCS